MQVALVCPCPVPICLLRGCQNETHQDKILKMSRVVLQNKVNSTWNKSCVIIIIIHEFHGDTSLKQNFRAAVNVTY